MDLERILQDRYGSGRPAINRTDASSTIEVMLEHRSCRSFADTPVDESTVELIMAAALSAPSKSDLQQTTILWLTDPKLRRSVLELLPGDEYGWVYGAPEAFMFCADNRRIRRAADRLGRPFPNNNLDQFMNAAVDMARRHPPIDRATIAL